MKEIKFKVNNGFDKNYITYGIDFTQIHLGIIKYYDKECDEWLNCIDFRQYTGLKDKNDMEIYEGDILEIYNNELDESDSWRDKVSIHNGCFFSGDEDLLINISFRCKVIGNIYENEELLKAE